MSLTFTDEQLDWLLDRELPQASQALLRAGRPADTGRRLRTPSAGCRRALDGRHESDANESDPMEADAADERRDILMLWE